MSIEAPTGGVLTWLGQAWLVLVLALVFGGGLAGLHLGLADRIAANKVKAIEAQAPALITGCERIEPMVIGGLTVYQAHRGDAAIGWLLPTGGQGFADRIEVVVALDPPAERILGMFVLDQKETPGLGDFITLANWRDQFKGMAADQPTSVVKGGAVAADNQVDAVTGATISSVAVSDIVNKGCSRFRDALRKEAGNE